MNLSNEVAAPVRRPKAKLADLVIQTLRKRIGAEEYPAGSKLPTESQMTAIFGVSRTVVREAIAALAADGLVQSRQGAGVFVLARQGMRSIDSGNRISDAINVLEVRMGIEIESAGLAAQRRTNSQDVAIHEAFHAFDRLLERDEATGKADFNIHHAIAAATNNPFYVEVLDALGIRAIPCDVTAPWPTEIFMPREYQRAVQAEHWLIVSAISAQDVEGARTAMRRHLVRSQELYRRRLLEGAPPLDGRQ
jgi:GntR family transcriptional repressor for pyruvate dehydrogenase complex